jgi:uncharacterized membrane protein YcaP (DUF421 family)
MFLNNPSDLVRVVVVGILAYLALILILRISGKRTLAKMNAFDLIVTVAIGSVLATTLTSSDVALLNGIVALTVLIGMQFLIAWLSVRSSTISGWVKSEPKLLFHQGEFLKQALLYERVTEEEVRSAVRAQGLASMESVEAVVLETDGSFSVLRKTGQSASALYGVSGMPDQK